MKRWRSRLELVTVTLLAICIFTPPVFAAFSFSAFFGDFLSIDYEGTGTVTHMNPNRPTPIDNGRTSLLSLNIMRASDLRIEVSGSFSGTLRVGQPGTAGGITITEYQVPTFSLTTPSFVRVNQTFSNAVYALDSAAAADLQSHIDLHGPDNLFLRLSLSAGPSSGGTMRVFSAVREINIDLKPGNGGNTINPRGRGKLTVAILTTANFDANTVDVDSLRFGATGSEAIAEHSAFDDVDGDGDLDLVLHFRTQQTNIGCGAEVALLRGTSVTGELIGRWDTVLTVGCR